MKFRKQFLLLAFCLFFQLSYGQTASIKSSVDGKASNQQITEQKELRVEPPNWWSGMKNNTVQLMVHGDKIADYIPSINQKGITLDSIHKAESPNYLFIDLSIAPSVTTANFNIDFSKGNKVAFSHPYQILERTAKGDTKQGFDNTDVIYLITPDRFANGDTENDEMKGYLEGPNREFIGGRHGGDIAGVLEHLDYMADMGFTALWLNPVLENNMESYSYHGYAITDFYKVDDRYGNNEMYVELSKKCKEKGIKIVNDMIMNHCGSLHWWMNDLPFSDWVNYQKEALEKNYKQTTHKRTIVQDPYSAKIDQREFSDGWFVPTMPDLNQRNPFMAKYLIQNTIWWIEYADLNGIRMDTYSYPDKDFMRNWTCAVMDEYPNLNIVGEEWSLNPGLVAHWQKGKVNANGYTSCLPALFDFPLQSALVEGLNSDESDYSGMARMYEMLANDFIYADPSNLVVFPDNHDMDRFFTQVNEDFDLFKLGMTYVLTTRGIPQIYYGTEILITNDVRNDHGVIRADFPGGWENDTVNGFTGKGLTEQQTEAQQFVKKLLNWRKSNDVFHNGKLMHYAPKEGVYVYFRYTDNEKVMIALSKNEEEVELSLDRFNEILPKDMIGKDIFTGEKLELKDKLTVPANSPLILEISDSGI